MLRTALASVCDANVFLGETKRLLFQRHIAADKPFVRDDIARCVPHQHVRIVMERIDALRA